MVFEFSAKLAANSTAEFELIFHVFQVQKLRGKVIFHHNKVKHIWQLERPQASIKNVPMICWSLEKSSNCSICFL